MTREEITEFEKMKDHDILVKLAQAFVDFKDHIEELCNERCSSQRERVEAVDRRVRGITWVCGVIGVAIIGAVIAHILGS